ncbi:secreted protein, partial [human gut metagenome]
MYSNMKIVILILLLFTGGSVIKAQRHYKRISALEGSYGTNIFGKLITWQIY